MSLIDKLLAIDSGELTKDETGTLEIKRLSKLVGEPFIITVKAIDGKRYQEFQNMIITKKGNIDYTKVYDVYALMALEGIVDPNISETALQKHFGAATPKDLIQKMFKGGELGKIADLIATVSGFGDEEETEIKN